MNGQTYTWQFYSVDGEGTVAARLMDESMIEVWPDADGDPPWVNPTE